MKQLVSLWERPHMMAALLHITYSIQMNVQCAKFIENYVRRFFS
jgi:hypothetical protein